MDVKRYLRGPVFWIILILLGVLLVTSISSATGGYKNVNTDVAIRAIQSGQVASAKLIDKDQQLQLTLKDGQEIQGSQKIQTDYVLARQRQLVNMLSANSSIDYTDNVPHTPWFVSLLITLLPIGLLVLIFIFFLNQMQGGGSRVMQFGKSKAKLISKDTPKTTFNERRCSPAP
jgi:cell division protease FtsH